MNVTGLAVPCGAMNPEQLRREISRLRKDITAVERAISISEGVFKQRFEDHLGKSSQAPNPRRARYRKLEAAVVGGSLEE